MQNGCLVIVKECFQTVNSKKWHITDQCGDWSKSSWGQRRFLRSISVCCRQLLRNCVFRSHLKIDLSISKAKRQPWQSGFIVCSCVYLPSTSKKHSSHWRSTSAVFEKRKKKKKNRSRNCCDSCQQLSAPSEMMKNWLRSAGEGSRRNTSHCISTPAPNVSESRNLRNMCPQFMQAEGYSGHPFQPINIPLFRIVLLNAHCSLARKISMAPLSIMLQWEMLNLKTDKWIRQKECIMTAGSSSND